MDNMIKLNKVNASNAVKPGYVPKRMHQKIELYLSLEERVIIIGSADNNYIYWLSVTSVKDRETNAQIFNHIANGKYDILTTLYKALESTQISYEELRKMYHASFCRTNSPGMEWETPFGHCYGTDQIPDNGTFFANDLASFPAKLKKQCEAREADGAYISVMKQYLEMLKTRSKDAVEDYYAAKPIIDIIQEEQYLVFSQKQSVRNLYCELCSQCNSLYNIYMSLIH